MTENNAGFRKNRQHEWRRASARSARYGIHYNSACFWRQYATVLWRIFKYALPIGRRRRLGNAQTV